MSSKSNLPVCVVTGGSIGIGAAICQKFASNQYKVINLDVVNHQQENRNVIWIPCDVSAPQDVKSAMDKVVAQYGRLDVLISNAGVHLSANIEQTTEEDLNRIIDINIKGAVTATKSALPQMKRQNSGVILFMSSDQALVAKPNSFAYNLSKCALASMAKTTAIDYAKYNIRANAICPGTIETPLYHKAIGNYVAKSGANKSQVHAEEQALQPLGRLGQPEEVAALALFLASNEANFITGSLQVIDGGYTAQ